MNKEDYFIQQIDKNKFNGDDGAVVGNLVYSMDAFNENVHFKREWMSLKEIARKSMLVNISDAIAMNAKPKYALLSVAIPKSYKKEELKELASGFNSVAKKFDMLIIGGDTVANDKLDISVTIISKTNKPLLRSGVKKGDFVCYTGTLGTSKRDLDTLLNGGTVDKKSKFIKPVLHPEFLYEVRPYINAGMDISDGLFFELERLSKINKIGFELLKNIPNEIGCSGEEYEMLFSFDPKNLKKVEQIANKHKVKLNIVAKANGKKQFQCPCLGHHF
jgi:thiamine-monophosphate kinase